VRRRRQEAGPDGSALARPRAATFMTGPEPGRIATDVVIRRLRLARTDPWQPGLTEIDPTEHGFEGNM
jgi:hypothetical protein